MIDPIVHTGQAIGWYRCDGKDCPVCNNMPSEQWIDILRKDANPTTLNNTNLKREILPLIESICRGYDYNPGSSDLDDEQSIVVRISLGEYRRAVRLYSELSR